MIKKNKDGSYNKFQLTVIILIAIISIFIISTLLIQNIQLPWNKQEETNPIKINNTNSFNTTERLYWIENETYNFNTTEKLYWIETETYNKEGGGGGNGYYTLIDPTHNKTYIPIGVNTTYYTNDGGEGKTWTIQNNTIAYVVVAGGGGGSQNLYENTNITYVGGDGTYVGGGGGSKSSSLYQNNIINSTQSPITTIQPQEFLNTSQNMTSIINIINTSPNILWISLIFLFGLAITSGFNQNTTIGIIFLTILIIIIWYLNIIQINNIIIFIIPLLTIYIYMKMIFQRR